MSRCIDLSCQIDRRSYEHRKFDTKDKEQDIKNALNAINNLLSKYKEK